MATLLTYDLFSQYQTDLNYSPNNDLKTVSEIDKSNQRIIRRLLTNQGDYIWEPNYGAGLPNFVSNPLTSDSDGQLEALINSQILLEDSVAKSPSPVIKFTNIYNAVLIQINYTFSPSGIPVVLTFQVQNGT